MHEHNRKLNHVQTTRQLREVSEILVDMVVRSRRSTSGKLNRYCCSYPSERFRSKLPNRAGTRRRLTVALTTFVLSKESRARHKIDQDCLACLIRFLPVSWFSRRKRCLSWLTAPSSLGIAPAQAHTTSKKGGGTTMGVDW